MGPHPSTEIQEASRPEGVSGPCAPDEKVLDSESLLRLREFFLLLDLWDRDQEK
jgi:hypothetical protein